ncbi:DNA sulfur modification protein DndB [Streptomyces cucumeris]|uniref:DNA sulfur modification protein DndB n=1 Tax=Streptomyces cucumeris TaxID=2962890 RepID=UPI003D7334FA
MTSIEIDPSRLSLVREESTYLALRTTQGGRTVYTTRVPLGDLSVILPLPDPAKPDPDNRKVDPVHAKGFGQYLADKPDWVAPTLLARDTGGCRFEPVSADGTVGYLTVPWALGGIARLITIDGQHRILGVHLEKKRITDEIARIDRDLLRTSNGTKKAKLEDERNLLLARMDRLKTEYVGLDIYVEMDGIRGQQMFVDVADNAKGISSAVRARFDTYRIANRTLGDVVEHPLLRGKVDIENDRMTARNRNLMGAKHVADLTRAVIAGPGGRISKKAEATLTDSEVIEQTKDFLNIISMAFTGLAAVTEEDIESYDPKLSEKPKNEVPVPPTKAMELRESSLLGSVGMLRVLAGVFKSLREDGVEDGDITEFFKRLDRHMAAPVADNSIWSTTNAKDDFELNASAPIMRTQNIVHLTGVITDWYRKPPAAI